MKMQTIDFEKCSYNFLVLWDDIATIVKNIATYSYVCDVCQVGGLAAQRPGGVNWASALILRPISANRGSIDSCQSDLSFVSNDIYRFTET